MRRNLFVWAFLIMNAMLVMACRGSAVSPALTSAPTANTPAANTPAANSTAVNSGTATISGTATAGGPGQTISVMVRNSEFTPKVQTVKKGTTVKWTNQDQIRHTVTADDGKSFDHPLTSGESFSFTFNTAGTFAYHCSIHGGSGGQGMSGTITVVE